MKISEIKVVKGISFYEAAIAHIATLPVDEVFTMQELADRMGRPVPTTSYIKKMLDVYGCKILVRGRSQHVYGNQKAIRALKKKLNSL